MECPFCGDGMERQGRDRDLFANGEQRLPGDAQ
jgi:hypothetical protein